MRSTLVTWGDDIVSRRKAAGLTQRELAQMAETTQQHLSLIERGSVSPGDELRMRLAAAFKTTVAELFPYPPDVAS
jgi:transcriptional regulator with XRE-family HTH domain